MKPIPSLAVPIVFLSLPLLAPRSPAQISAYHNVTSATHQSKFSVLSKLGYRPIALAVHGTYSSPRYSAVWEKKSGPAYYGFHDLQVTKFPAFYNARLAQGYHPEILAFHGSGISVRVAGLFVKSTGSFASWFGLSETAFKDKCAWARKNGFLPTCVAIYGSSANPTYAVIFKPNPSKTRWNYGIDSTPASFQKRFDAYARVAVRPALVAHNPYGRYVSVWRDDRLTAPFFMRHGMNSTVYQYYFNLYGKSGYHPIRLAAAGSGGATRWDAIFAKNTTVKSRIFSSTGTYVPALAGFDAWMKNLMVKYRIRAAGLAIAFGGELKYARGYTYAESGYPVTSPASVFRIASMSKPLTSIAVHRAQFEKRLKVTDPAYLKLPSTGFLDPRTKTVRLIHLLTHTGGWNIDLLKFDPMFYDFQIAKKLNTTVPITNAQIWDFMSRYQGLQANPGTKFAYSNYGFSNLGLILSGVYAGTYENVVRTKVMLPLGLKRPFLGRSLLSQRAAGEVLYHPRVPGVRTTVRSNSGAWVPIQYGGWSQENMNANGGWVMAPADYAKILASFDVGDANPVLPAGVAREMWTPPFPSIDNNLLRGWFRLAVKDAGNVSRWAYNHNGRLPGTSSIGFRRDDGLSVVVMCNADFNGFFGATHIYQLNALANKVPSWPAHDLFPSLGIPRLGSFTKFGASCKMPASTPVHSGVGHPLTGRSIGLRLEKAYGARIAILYMGFSKRSWGRISLPLPLDALGAPGCKLLVAPLIPLAVPVGLKGTAYLTLPIPPSPAYSGVRLFTQWVIHAPRANKLGLVLTNGLETRIGG